MSVTFRKGKAGDWKIVDDLICDMEGAELPAEAFHGIYDEKMDDSQFYPAHRKASPFRAGI